MLKGFSVGMALVGALLTLLACGPSGSSFRVKGKFQDMQAGELYIYNVSDENPRFDTLTIANGRFLYKGETSEVIPLMLVFPNGIEQVIFVGPGHDVKYEATANDLKNYVVNGNDENKLMNKFRQDTYTLAPAEVKAAASDFINAHPESLAAVYLFQAYFLNNPDATFKETKAALNTLKRSQPDNNYIKAIDRKMIAAERCHTGNTLKNTTLTLRDKTTKKLWDTERDYNLVCFWATWIPGGYDLNWQIRQLYDKYKASSQLRVVAISLDIERFRWEEITRNDSLSALEHYCDGLGFESPVAKQYGITSLPFFMLTDRSHKIIASTPSYETMRNEISHRLKSE